VLTTSSQAALFNLSAYKELMQEFLMDLFIRDTLAELTSLMVFTGDQCVT